MGATDAVTFPADLEPINRFDNKEIQKPKETCDRMQAKIIAVVRANSYEKEQRLRINLQGILVFVMPKINEIVHYGGRCRFCVESHHEEIAHAITTSLY